MTSASVKIKQKPSASDNIMASALLAISRNNTGTNEATERNNEADLSVKNGDASVSFHPQSYPKTLLSKSNTTVAKFKIFLHMFTNLGSL